MCRCVWIGLLIAPLVASNAIARADRIDAKPAERSAIAFEDIAIVIPLARADDDRRGAWVPRRTPEVTTADGAPLDVRVVFIATLPRARGEDAHDHSGDGNEHHPRPWLPIPPEIVTLDLDTPRISREIDNLIEESVSGQWMLIVSPRSGVRLDGLIIDAERFPMRPMARNAYTPRREIVDPTGADWSTLRTIVAPMLASPDERWRVRLLEDRISPKMVWGADDSARVDRRASLDPALEAIATQTEQRWRAALSIIEDHDEQTAIDLVRALTSVVRLPSGVIVPAWPAESQDHAQLLDAILAPELKASDAARRARGYINSIAGACLTVLDDNQGILALTEVRGQTLDATVAGRRVRLAPFQTDISVIPEGDGNTGGLSVAEVRAGPMRSKAAAMNGAAPVSPPGFRIGPMHEAWTLADWRSARPMPASGDHACAALVQRGPLGAGADVGGAAWQVYIECAAPHSGSAPGDEVVLYLGRTIRRVDAGGTIRDETGEEVARFPTIFDHGRWWAIVPVPREAIGADETLLIAMERREASGWRATWPRPLLPGDERPAPVRLDLRAWDRGVRGP